MQCESWKYDLTVPHLDAGVGLGMICKTQCIRQKFKHVLLYLEGWFPKRVPFQDPFSKAYECTPKREQC